MRRRHLTPCLVVILILFPLVLRYTPIVQAQPASVNGYVVVPLLGGTPIPLSAATSLVLADLRLTQSGLVDQPLPPFPLVAGKTAMLRGTLASKPGSPQATTAAFLDVIREETGQLVATT